MEEKETKEQEQQENIIYSESLRVGDLYLCSATAPISALADLVIALLRQKEIISYLDLKKKRGQPLTYWD